jgi:hypothetical protein
VRETDSGVLGAFRSLPTEYSYKSSSLYDQWLPRLILGLLTHGRYADDVRDYCRSHLHRHSTLTPLEPSTPSQRYESVSGTGSRKHVATPRLESLLAPIRIQVDSSNQHPWTILIRESVICRIGLAQRFEVTEAQSTYDLNRLCPPMPHPTTGIMTKRTVKSQSMNNAKIWGSFLRPHCWYAKSTTGVRFQDQSFCGDQRAGSPARLDDLLKFWKQTYDNTRILKPIYQLMVLPSGCSRLQNLLVELLRT